MSRLNALELTAFKPNTPRGGAKHLTFANQVSNCRCVNCMPVSWISRPSYLKGGWFKSLTMGTQEWTAIKISLTCTEEISSIQELPQLKMWDVECFFRDMVGTFYTSHRQVKLEESSPKRMDPSLPSIITVLSNAFIWCTCEYILQCASWSSFSSLTSYCNITDHNYL